MRLEQRREVNIAFNMSTLKRGGGQNVGLNFLMNIMELRLCTNSIFIVVKNSEIDLFLKDKNVNLYYTFSNPVLRIIDEFTRLSLLLLKNKVDLVYTYFGYSYYWTRFTQVCGVAVSNIFFPEIQFWSGRLHQIAVKKIIDGVRLKGLKRADGLIFENAGMYERCERILKKEEVMKSLIRPSINIVNDVLSCGWNIETISNPKVLVFCSWQLNKNIMLIPEIAHNLKLLGILIKFIITAPQDGSALNLQFENLIRKFDVHDYFEFIGVCEKKNIPYLYNHVDMVLLLSKLESFSNNIIESWKFEKPLIVSDAVWSRRICRSAAYYVNRDNAIEIAQAIVVLSKNSELKTDLIRNGIEELSLYPSINERTSLELDFLFQVINRNAQL